MEDMWDPSPKAPTTAKEEPLSTPIMNKIKSIFNKMIEVDWIVGAVQANKSRKARQK